MLVYYSVWQYSHNAMQKYTETHLLGFNIRLERTAKESRETHIQLITLASYEAFPLSE